MRSAPLVALLVAAVLAAPATAQTPAPAFTASSITPNTGGGSTTGFQIFPGGQFRATNATVRQLVQAAYDFQFERFQIVGGPAWIDVDRFDVQATPAVDAATSERIATPQEIAGRVQALLADRFNLVMRRETRLLGRFDLVVARPGVVKQTAGTCAPPGQSQAAADTRLRCGFSYLPDAGDVQRVVGQSVTIADLARRLQGSVEAVIVDKTGLTGRYDVTLDYVRPRNLQGQEPGSAGVSLFTAVQEQLGLRLESARGPVEVIVIDRVEKPTAN